MKQNITFRRQPTEIEISRFWSFVKKSNKCWEYVGPIKPNGYGCYHFDSRVWNAHRFSWFISHPEISAQGLFVCHRCDNPPCVRPEHLFLGTPRQNMQDMKSKGRHIAGRDAIHNKRIAHKLLVKRIHHAQTGYVPYEGFLPEEIVETTCERLDDIRDFKDVA